MSYDTKIEIAKATAEIRGSLLMLDKAHQFLAGAGEVQYSTKLKEIYEKLDKMQKSIVSLLSEGYTNF